MAYAVTDKIKEEAKRIEVDKNIENTLLFIDDLFTIFNISKSVTDANRAKYQNDFLAIVRKISDLSKQEE